MSDDKITPVMTDVRAINDPQPVPDGTVVDSSGKILSPVTTDKEPIEAWGKALGLLPEWLEQPPVQVKIGGEIRTVPAPPKHNLEYWKFAAAKSLRGWPIGAEVTGEEFATAVHEACNSRIG